MLAALIPAQDEGARIAAVLSALRAALPQCRLIVIDGDSTDHTARESARLGAEVLVQHGGGYAAALRTGYRHLWALGAQRVIQLDGDGQHPPSQAPRLLAGLASANLVIGSRAGTASPGPPARRLGNAVLARAVRHITGLPLLDVTSGYWALDRQALGVLSRCLPGDVADANVRVLAARTGLVITERSVRMDRRQGGRSMHDGVAGVVNLWASARAVVRAARTPAVDSAPGVPETGAAPSPPTPPSAGFSRTASC